MNLSYPEKIDIINKYVDQEMVFQDCGFDIHKKQPKNPYRNDKKPGSCNWKWYQGVLYFFDWTYPFDNGTKKHITIYGAVKLNRNLITNKEAIDFIVEKYVWNIAESEREEKAKLIQSKKKKTEKEDVVVIDVKTRKFSGINYWTNYFLYNNDLLTENVYIADKYEIIKNDRDITKYFPTHEEANDLAIAYKYNDKWKLYWPKLKQGIKKPRFMSNIKSSKVIEGYNQIHNPKNKVAILLGSKKDYMICRYPLREIKADFYATQNEGNYLPDYFLKALKNNYEYIFTLFDNDESGVKAAIRLVLHHELTGQIILPNIYSKDNKLLKDPAAIIYHHKKEKTLNTIRNSNRISYEEIKQLHESAHEIDPLAWQDI